MDILSVATQEVQEIFSQVVCDASVSLETLEASVNQACRELGRKVLEDCFSESAAESDSASVACAACSGEARRLRQRKCYIETLCGVVRVSRWVYRCACGVSVVPWDSREGLKDGAYTVGVAQTMCRLAARLDFREAASELKHHGIRVSHTTLQHKIQRWAAGESISTYVDPQSLEPGSRWYVSCDGCYTASETDGWQEVKVGCLYRDDRHPDPGSIASTRSSSLRYVASRGDAVSFGSHWFDLATASGIYQDETDTEEVVVIGDGAAWIWNLSQEYFPGATEIVDYMHAKSHLYESGKLAYGETQDTAPKVERWVRATEPFLYAGDIQEVIARIRALGIGNHASVSESLQTQAGYFLKHAHRMQYQRFVENGYHIGSGIIESACKHVVAERCKQAGMRWSQDGINAILFWRCLLENGAWDTFWDKRSKTA